MSKYRKKPVVIEAIQWNGGNDQEVLEFCFSDKCWKDGLDSGYVDPGIGFTPAMGTFDIPTLEGVMTVEIGDYIVRGTEGELYPCKPIAFERSHELVEDGETS